MRDWAKDWYTLVYVVRRRWKGIAVAVFVLLLTPFIAWSAVTLENPSPGAIKSGVGLISGWICDADELEVSFDDGPRVFVPYGSDREDTRGVCGNADNGFGLLFNYNELGDGPHTITLYADGRAATQVNFSVQTLGTNFLQGVSGQGTIPLSNGATVTVRWEETTQGFAIIGYEENGGGRPPEDLGDCPGCLPELRVLLGEWIAEMTLEINNQIDEFSLVLTAVQTTERGYPVLVGELQDISGTWIPIQVGYARDLVPNIPMTQRYALLNMYEFDEAIQAEDEIFTAICGVISFNATDLDLDRYGEMVFPVVSHVTVYETGACTNRYPFGGPHKAELYLYPPY